MKKKLIKRLQELKYQVSQLPENYYSDEDFKEYHNNDNKEFRNKIIERINTKFDYKNNIYRKILAFFRANLDKERNEEYFNSLGEITFRPKGGLLFNTFYYENNEAWKADKCKLMNLLDLLENELQEKMTNSSTEAEKLFSGTAMVSNGLFWTIVTVLCGVSYFLGLYKAEFDKSDLENDLKRQQVKYQKLNKENQELRIRLNDINDK